VKQAKQPATKVFGIFLEGAQARAGHKLPCGLSYCENPLAWKYEVVVYAIGNCHDRAVSRVVDFGPDQPEPHSNCITIPAHHTATGAWSIDRNQCDSHRSTDMLACR